MITAAVGVPTSMLSLAGDTIGWWDLKSSLYLLVKDRSCKHSSRPQLVTDCIVHGLPPTRDALQEAALFLCAQSFDIFEGWVHVYQCSSKGRNDKTNMECRDAL